MLSMYQEQVFKHQKHIINNLLNIIKHHINNKNKQSYYNFHLKHLKHICKNNLNMVESIQKYHEQHLNK